MRLFGLIGKKLGHSFSKGYFSNKFVEEGITDCRYELFELASIEELPALLSGQPELEGLNVTIPYKQDVFPYLHALDDSAKKVGAVNVIKRSTEGKLTGYNSDYYGFRTSLENWLPTGFDEQALVLGTGGASRAVCAALLDMGIGYVQVSRQEGEQQVTYEEVKKEGMLSNHPLVINTTPLGMHPQTETAPDLPYHEAGKNHYFYDLVYNPAETRFMLLGKEQGASAMNGLEMLHLQAEKSWEIWNG